MDYRARLVRHGSIDPETEHEFVIAGQNGTSADIGTDALACEILGRGDIGTDDFAPAGLSQSDSDRVVGIDLGGGRKCQQVSGFAAVERYDGGHIEIAFRERAGLVEDDGAEPGQCFETVGAFDQYSTSRGAADSGEKRERDGYDQCART